MKKRNKQEDDDDEDEEVSGTRHDALQNIFDDEDEGFDDRGGYDDEMDRFIDDDEEDEDLDDRRHDRREKAPAKSRARRAPIEGMNEE